MRSFYQKVLFTFFVFLLFIDSSEASHSYQGWPDNCSALVSRAECFVGSNERVLLLSVGSLGLASVVTFAGNLSLILNQTSGKELVASRRALSLAWGSSGIVVNTLAVGVGLPLTVIAGGLGGFASLSTLVYGSVGLLGVIAGSLSIYTLFKSRTTRRMSRKKPVVQATTKLTLLREGF